MSRFGDVPITTQQLPQQMWLMTVPYLSIPANSAANVYPGSFTVQTAGTVTAEFKIRLAWTGSDAWSRTHLGASSPAPGYTSNFAFRTGLPGGYQMIKEIPILAIWYNVTPGQVISTGIYTYAGISGMTLIAAGGIIRNSTS